MDARIDRLQRLSAGAPDTFALGGGLPADELVPRVSIVRAFERAMHEPDGHALQYGWPEGDRGLRSWIAARLAARGADVAVDDVIVTSGAQQALAIAGELLLARGALVAVDAESYPAALDLFRTIGAAPTLEPEGASCIYAMPGIANPRGDLLSHARREALLRSGLPVVADEAYAELRFDGVIERPLLADARDRVWHVGSLSKTVCPGLRVGWLVPPRARRESALRLKRDRDLHAGTLAQAIARHLLEEEDYDALLARARAYYAPRARRLARALRSRLPGWRFRAPRGGFSIFVETDLEGDDAHLLAIATHCGVAFDPGRLFRHDERSSPIALRLCFSSVPAHALDEAVGRLERAARLFATNGRRSRLG